MSRWLAHLCLSPQTPSAVDERSNASGEEHCPRTVEEVELVEEDRLVFLAFEDLENILKGSCLEDSDPMVRLSIEPN